MKVPLLDLGPQMNRLRAEILEAVTRVLDSTCYILGPEVRELEQAVARYCSCDFGIGVSSGTDALLASLMCLDLQPGDQVLTTPYTFFATMGSIIRAGATPVFADIDQDSMNIDPQAVAEKLEADRHNQRRIRALLPVHLFGQCADMDRLLELAARFEIPVIEDAAQAIGAHYPHREQGHVVWKRAGAMGLAGCFSFFPSKNLGGIGDGGMVVTDSASLAAKLVACRNHGADKQYHHGRIGGNFRLDPIQAAVLKVKLRHLDEWHAGRQRNAALYRRFFQEAGLIDNPVVLPREAYCDLAGSEHHQHHIYNQFVIRVPKRDALANVLQEQEIGCAIYYPLCLHQQPCLEALGYGNQAFPQAERAAAESLALPIHPDLTAEQLHHVVVTIARFYHD